MHVLWTVYGGQPLRFSLDEFEAVTGLPCGEFADGYDHEIQLHVVDESYAYWNELIGTNRQTTLAEVAEKLQNWRSPPAMPSWRRIRLALILIVDGVLIASTQQHKPTPKYVKLAQNLDEFFAFPWGRESFSWTLSSMKPGRKVMGKCDNPVGTYRDQLLQVSFRLVGFPLALQLVAFEAIPSLLSKLGRSVDGVTLMDITDDKISKSSALTLSHVLDAEADEQLVVKTTVGNRGVGAGRWCVWDDEIRDRKVEYMEEKIASGYVFKKSEWPGGDASLPLISHSSKSIHWKPHQLGRGSVRGGAR